MFKEEFMNSQKITAVLLLAMGLAVSSNVWSAQAGLVQFVNGDVELTTAAGVSHAAHKGDPVNEGDTITSAKAASAQIKMQDGGFIAVRPDTKLKFDQFVFSGKQDGDEKSFFSLFKGGFRAVTGLIGQINKQNYKITTPAATIGIRGTDHETVMVLPDNPLVAAGQAAPGAYNKVNVGETSITTEKGTLTVLPNQMGFAGGRNEMPQLKPINTGLFTVAPQASSGAKMNSGKGGEQGARNTAVVDATPQAAAGGNTTSTTSVATVSVLPNVAPPTVVITPAVVLGPANVPIAPFVNTEIAWGMATPTFWLNGGWVTAESSGKNSSSISPLPNPSSFVDSFGNGSGCVNCATSFSLALSGGTPVSYSNAATGIQWGYRTGAQGTETVTGPTPYSSGPVNNTSITWIAAPAANWVLPMALTGTATYNNVLGSVTTDGTNIGAVTSAALGVDFGMQSVSLTSLIANSGTGGVTWTASGTGASLGHGGGGNAGFVFNTAGWCNTGCSGQGTLTLSGPVGPFSGSVSGSLTGNGLTGAILNFDFSSYLNGSNLAGVAALGLSTATPPINTAAPYQAVLSSIPMIPGNLTPYATLPLVQDTANGAIFNPATLSLNTAGGFIPQINSNLLNTEGLIAGQASATIAGSTAVDAGTDPVSGIKWGRWSGGTVNYIALNGSGATGPQSIPLGGIHWITPPASSGSNSLPVSGTYNYVLAGGTRPTDQLGNMGTLNSASLSANFTAMTVNMAANVTVANTTFNGSATGVPIQNGMVFGTDKGGTYSATCSGSCGGGVVAGNAVGVFTQAGLGAAVTYGFQTGPSIGSPTTVVGGVAAFHR